jgi:hypothetical protein
VRGDAGDRPDPRPVSRAGPVAGAAGGPRPGKVIADLRLRLAERWPWAGENAAAVTRLQALPSVLPVPTATMTRKGNTRAAEPRPPGATAWHPRAALRDSDAAAGGGHYMNDVVGPGMRMCRQLSPIEALSCDDLACRALGRQPTTHPWQRSRGQRGT